MVILGTECLDQRVRTDYHRRIWSIHRWGGVDQSERSESPDVALGYFPGPHRCALLSRCPPGSHYCDCSRWDSPRLAVRRNGNSRRHPICGSFSLFVGIVLVFNGLAEEPGWRGFLLPRLQATHSALTASLLVGVVWWGWHLPLLFLPGHTLTGINPWIFLLGIIGLSVILTWLTNAVKGSILPALFFHASYNVSTLYYPVGGIEGVTMSLTGTSLLFAIYGTLVVVLLVHYGPARLAPISQSVVDSSIADRAEHE